MSDDKPAAPAPAPAPAARIIENPMTAWMRGGTMTSAYEQQLARQKAAAAEARRIEDSKRVAAEQNPHEAKQYKRVIGGNKHYAGIILEVKHPKDNVVLDYISCELTMGPDEKLVLVMACYRCFMRTGEASNLTIRQGHRHFELDTRRQGELWVNPKNPNEIVTLAGTINLTERVTCPGCGMVFVIDDSVVREV